MCGAKINQRLVKCSYPPRRLERLDESNERSLNDIITITVTERDQKRLLVASFAELCIIIKKLLLETKWLQWSD